MRSVLILRLLLSSLAIATATRLGLVQGDTDVSGHLKGTLRPNDSVNRAEIAKIMILALHMRVH